MAFIVEDGNGVKGANSYGTVADYKAYFADRGVTITDATSVIQTALVKGTDYIEVRFGQRIKGQKAHNTLFSRSILTFTVQPLNDEMVTVGTVIYTFKTTLTVPVVETEVEIGANLATTITSLGVAMGNASNEDLVAVTSNDIDTLHIFVVRDGITTTTTVTGATFDLAASNGFSSSPQPLAFPRKNLVDDDSGLDILGVPDGAEKATFEYASRAITAALLPDPVVEANGLKLKSDKTKIGPLEFEKAFVEEISAVTTKPYPAADLLIFPFLRATGAAIR